MDIIQKLQYKLLQTKYSAKSIFSSADCIIINSVCHPHGFDLMKENWGDDINMIIPNLISGKEVIPYNLLFPSIRNSQVTNYMCIGSIINWMTNSKSVIWGSGAICNTIPIQAKPKKVTAVRGPLTRDFLIKSGVSCPNVYGDPALLLPLYYNPICSNRHHIGIIPHISDRSSSVIKELRRMSNTTFIDLGNYDSNWKSVIDKINSCEIIVSSSLHGLIIAEAYGIPNVWVSIDNNIIGGEFKYQDFFKSIKQERSPILLTTDNLSKDFIDNCALMWRKSKINLTDQLLDSCPFI